MKNRLLEQIKKLRRKNRKLSGECDELKKQTDRLKKHKEILEQQKQALEEKLRELKLLLHEYQQMLFKKSATKKSLAVPDKKIKKIKKKGAPFGHEGKTRKTPEKIDIHKDIHVYECPECKGNDLSPCNRFEDHYQEDIIIPEVEVTRFRHHYYYCHDCKKAVHGVGEGELVGSFIGPNAKSLASFLHYEMAMPYRKIEVLFKECFNLDIVASSCVGFDKQLRNRGQPLYERMRSQLKDKNYLHVDETGWKDKWLWCYASKGSVVYAIENGRGQKQVKNILGKKYSGVLISDFLSAYNKIICRKQRCLVHLLRLIKKKQIYFD